MSLSATLSASVFTRQTKPDDLSTPEDVVMRRAAVQLLDGSTGAGKADRVFHDRRTLAASATEDLDLAGVLTDKFGAAITFARVKGLYVQAAVGNTNDVLVGAAAATPWAALLNATGTLRLRPGAFALVSAGAADVACYAVGAGSADFLRVANSAAGTSVTYDVVIVGSSA